MAVKKIVILVLGYLGVGKSQLISKGVHEVLGGKYYPPGKDDSDRYSTHIASHKGIVDGIKFKFEIVDTGNRDYDSHNIKRANAIIFVCAYDFDFSLTRIDHFLEDTMKDITSPVPMFVFANKCDLALEERKISRPEIEKFATNNGCEFVETSLFSKDDHIKEAFCEVLGRAVDHAEKYPKKPNLSKTRYCSIQ